MPSPQRLRRQIQTTEEQIRREQCVAAALQDYEHAMRACGQWGAAERFAVKLAIARVEHWRERLNKLLMRKAVGD